MNTEIKEIAQRFKDCEDRWEVATAGLKAVNMEYEALQEELLEAMVAEGVNSVELDGVGICKLETRNYLSLTKANEAAFFQYLRDNGQGGLIQDTVNAATLKAFMDEDLDRRIRLFTDAGLNLIEAREKALAEIKELGISAFSKKKVNFKAIKTPKGKV